MPRPDCEFCGGTGWVSTDRDGLAMAERCNCVAEVYSEQLESRADIPANYRHASFDNFVLPHDNPVARGNLVRVMTAVKRYANLYPKTPKPGLLLVGPPGTGKTHLAVAAIRMLLDRGHEGIFYDYQNLLERIRSSYNPTLGTSDREAYRVALDTEVLLLDDLGAHRVTDWVEDTVTAIVTHRYNHQKPLIATTNLPDPLMGGSSVEKSALGGHSFKTTLEERVGERARSRLFEMCTIVDLWGMDDYRTRRPR